MQDESSDCALFLVGNNIKKDRLDFETVELLGFLNQNGKLSVENNQATVHGIHKDIIILIVHILAVGDKE